MASDSADGDPAGRADGLFEVSRAMAAEEAGSHRKRLLIRRCIGIAGFTVLFGALVIALLGGVAWQTRRGMSRFFRTNLPQLPGSSPGGSSRFDDAGTPDTAALTIDEIIDGLKSADEEERLASARALCFQKIPAWKTGFAFVADEWSALNKGSTSGPPAATEPDSPLRRLRRQYRSAWLRDKDAVPRLLPPLVAALEDEETLVVARAADALGELLVMDVLGEDSKQVAEALRQLFNSDNDSAQAYAIWAVSIADPKLSDKPSYLEAARNEHPLVCYQGVLAISCLPETDCQVEQLVLRAMRHVDPEIRLAGVQLAGDLQVSPEAVVAQALEATEDKDARVRLAAIGTIVALSIDSGPVAMHRAMAAIAPLLNDSDQDVRDTATDAIAILESERANGKVQ